MTVINVPCFILFSSGEMPWPTCTTNFKVTLKISRYVFVALAGGIFLQLILYYQDIEVTHFFIDKKKELIRLFPNVSNKSTVNRYETKTILLYNAKHWEKAIWKSFTNNTFWNNCPYTCQITTDKQLYNISNAVIFVVDLLGGGELPQKLPNQVWIFAQYESTNYLLKEFGSKFLTENNMRKYNNKVNWTISYRRDSDFPFVHGVYNVKKRTDVDKKVKNSSTSKRGIAWFVSHCSTTSKRESYVRSLQKSISVDIYGSCGKLKPPKGCPKTRDVAIRECWGLVKSQCYDILDKKYLFYLSFENAICKDYVTEKGLHHVTQHNIIPIMRGGANYSLFSPPRSYIDTKDFSSIGQLSSYLKSVENDPGLQKQFVEWKRNYVSGYATESWRGNMCNICRRLNDREKYIRMYGDIYKWIVTPNNQHDCYPPNDLI